MFYSLLNLKLDEGSGTDGDEGPALDTVLGGLLTYQGDCEADWFRTGVDIGVS